MKTKFQTVVNVFLAAALLLCGCKSDQLSIPSTTPPPTLSPSSMPTLTPSQTPTLKPTHIPTLEAINPENSSKIVLKARYGKGTASSWAFSPDGTILAVGGPFGVDIYNASTLEKTRSLETTSVYQIAFSPNGEYLAAGLTDTVVIWKVSDGTLVYTLGHAHHMQAVAFSPDGSLLASGANDGRVILWNMTDGSVFRTLRHEDGVTGVAFSPDGGMVAAVSNAWKGNSTWLWQVKTGELVKVLKGPQTETLERMYFTPQVGVTFSPDGALLAAGSFVNNSVLVWKVADWSLLHTQNGMEAAFSPDGKMLATTDAGQGSIRGDESIELFQVSDWSSLKTIPGFGLGFSPDWTQLAYSTGGPLFGGAIEILNMQSGDLKGTIDGYYGPVTSIEFSPDGAYLASGYQDGTVWLWRSIDGYPERVAQWHNQAVVSIAYSPDGQWLAAGYAKNLISLWNRVEDTEYQIPGSFMIAAFSADGGLLATGSPEGSVSIWRVSDWSFVRTLETDPNPYECYVRTIAFSPDGEFVALGSRLEGIKVWKVSDGSLVFSTAGTDLVFTQDGKMWSAGEFGEARLWKTADWTQSHQIPLAGYMEDLAFSLSGGLLAMSSGNRVYLQQLSNGVVVDRETGINPNKYMLTFSPDGAFLAAGSVDGTVTIFGLRNP